MISNSDLLFNRALDFQKKRKEMKDSLKASVKKLEKYRGSEGYQVEVEKLNRQYESNIAELQAEYRKTFAAILDGMSDAIGSKPAKAPTSEQLNLINMLRLKKKPTKSDCERVANSCIDNPMALSIITEIAAENGIHRNYTRLCPEMDNTRAAQIVDNLKDGIEDFVKYDSSRASRAAQQYYRINQGIETELVERRMFNDKEGCFSALCALDREDLSAFCEVADD